MFYNCLLNKIVISHIDFGSILHSLCFLNYADDTIIVGPILEDYKVSYKQIT